jgi:hypothetical protein
VRPPDWPAPPPSPPRRPAAPPAPPRPRCPAPLPRPRPLAGALAWEPGELATQIKAGGWFTAAAARPLLLKQVLQLPKPLWQEVLELMGGAYAAHARAARQDEGDE